MIIIIEGIDRVGKTTLANKLSTQLNIPIFKKDRIGLNSDSSTNMMLANFGNAKGLVDMWNWDKFKMDMIVDRFHWTESVYGRVDRNNSTDFYMGIVEEAMLLKKDKYLIVYIRPTSIERSSEEHGKDLSEHLKLFDELASKTKLNLMICDYNQIDKMVDIIKNIIMNRS